MKRRNALKNLGLLGSATVFSTLETRKVFAEKIIEAYKIEESNVFRWEDGLKTEIEDLALFDELNKINNLDRTDYNPFHVEFYLQDCISLVNKLVQTRDYIKGLEISLWNETIKNQLFNERIISPAEDDEFYAYIAGNIEKKIVNKNLNTKLGTYETVLNGLQTNENYGLNYLQRYIDMKKMYREDYIDFFRKIKCVERGLKTVYNLQITNLPTLVPSTRYNLLSLYYTWLKEAVLELTKFLKEEQEQLIMISLMQGYQVPLSGETKPIVEKMFDSNGVISFKLKDKNILNDKSCVRIRDIAIFVPLDVTFARKDAKDFYDYDIRSDYWNATVEIPLQTDSIGKEWKIPTIKLNCPLINSKEIIGAFANSRSYFNANPFVDKDWKITFASNSTILGRDREDIADLLLVLKLAFIP